MSPKPPALRSFLTFSAQAVAATAAVALIGLIPTQHLAGPQALRSMLAGCAVGLLASLAGAVPVVLVKARGADSVTLALGVMVLRLVVAGSLAAGGVFSGWFSPRPFLAWVVLSHLVLLVIDSRFTARALRKAAEEEPVKAESEETERE